jgi:hypothetical protein
MQNLLGGLTKIIRINTPPTVAPPLPGQLPQDRYNRNDYSGIFFEQSYSFITKSNDYQTSIAFQGNESGHYCSNDLILDQIALMGK